jgi:secreted PhoX family phosphatase
VQVFVAGTAEQAMMDNVAYQPGRGNWILHEDGDGAQLAQPRNNDLWDCLADGQDDDDQSDGCIRIGTLNDLTAEWTGGVFDATGKRFFVSVQHNITGQGVVLEITGWR